MKRSVCNCTYCGHSHSVGINPNIYGNTEEFVAQCEYCGERTDSFSTEEKCLNAYISGNLYHSYDFDLVREEFWPDCMTDGKVLQLVEKAYESWLNDYNKAKEIYSHSQTRLNKIRLESIKDELCLIASYMTEPQLLKKFA